MTRALTVRPEAEADLQEGWRWYDSQSRRVAAEFLEEVGHGVSRIAENPHQFPRIYRNVRRALVRRFPYGIHYIVEPERLVVLAIFHQARDPERWKKRR